MQHRNAPVKWKSNTGCSNGATSPLFHFSVFGGGNNVTANGNEGSQNSIEYVRCENEPGKVDVE
jgi:hypothetical protein